MPGTASSDARIVRRTAGGFRLVVSGEELVLSFSDFPWFERATAEQLATVRLHGRDHLSWPLLDVDLSVESIRHPERFPLVAREG